LLAALFAAVLLRIRNRHYRAVCQAESTDSDRDGVPDVYQSKEPTGGGAA
jgi:NhaA family Na+:H+ antiporter